MNVEFMKIAFLEAEKAFNLDEVPIGAVIVKNNEIIAKAHNMKEHDKSCISHAEILAIKEASESLDNWRLDDCDIYVTLDPCPMCASAIKQSRINNVYSALSNSDFSNSDIISSIFNYTDHTNSKVNFVSNLDVDNSKKILSDFFSRQRIN